MNQNPTNLFVGVCQNEDELRILLEVLELKLFSSF